MVRNLRSFVAVIFCAFYSSFAYAQTNTISSTVIDKSVPAANAPSVVVNNSDVCVSSITAGVTTQIFGIAGGSAVRDKNCEIIKMFRLLYGGGMKVAAISLICNEDYRVFNAMWRAGTPCPAGEGLIGDEAKQWWLKNADKAPEESIVYVSHKQKQQTHQWNNEPEEWLGE